MRISYGSSDVCSYDLGRAKQKGALVIMDVEIVAFGFRPFDLPQQQAHMIVASLHPNLPFVAVGRGGRRLLPQLVDDAFEMGGMLRGAFLFDLVAGMIERDRSEEHTSELQSLMRISYAVFCLKKKKTK